MPPTNDGGYLLDDSETAVDLMTLAQPTPDRPAASPAPGAKASFEECVQAVMDQPGFEPQGDRTPEESARAICATKPGGPQEGKAEKAVDDIHYHALPDGSLTGPPVYEDAEIDDAALPTGDGMAPMILAGGGDSSPSSSSPGGSSTGGAGKLKSADELSAIRSAILSDDPDGLPARGQEIWTRMHESSKRFAAGRYPDSYPRAVAWYAIRRKYHLEDQKGGGGQVLATQNTTRKTVGSFAVVGGWTVKMGSSTPASAWDRLDTIPVPWQRDATLTVGYSNGGQATITAVFVPLSAVKSNDETGGAAMRWVREHWEILFRLGKSGSIFDQGLFDQVEGKRWTRFAKFVLTPESATKQIAYGIAYPSWEVDLQGQFATEEEVETMAHKFMLHNGMPGEMHSRFQLPNGNPPYRIVESYIAPAGHPHFQESDWIVGAKFQDEVWAKIKTHDYKGFSIAGNWGRRVLSFAEAARS